EFSWALVRASALGGGSTRRAALRVVGQTLAGKEGLLAGREAELLGAVATGQTTVLVHPLQTLLGSDAYDARDPDTEWATGRRRRAWIGVRARSARARSPELIAVKIRVPSRPLNPFRNLTRSVEPSARVERPGAMSIMSRSAALAALVVVLAACSGAA